MASLCVLCYGMYPRLEGWKILRESERREREKEGGERGWDRKRERWGEEERERREEEERERPREERKDMDKLDVSAGVRCFLRNKIKLVRIRFSVRVVVRFIPAIVKSRQRLRAYAPSIIQIFEAALK
eukprot:1392933-Amorphochlora_amoeboformis.AAC.1